MIGESTFHVSARIVPPVTFQTPVPLFSVPTPQPISSAPEPPATASI